MKTRSIILEPAFEWAMQNLFGLGWEESKIGSWLLIQAAEVSALSELELGWRRLQSGQVVLEIACRFRRQSCRLIVLTAIFENTIELRDALLVRLIPPLAA